MSRFVVALLLAALVQSQESPSPTPSPNNGTVVLSVAALFAHIHRLHAFETLLWMQNGNTTSGQAPFFANDPHPFEALMRHLQVPFVHIIEWRAECQLKRHFNSHLLAAVLLTDGELNAVHSGLLHSLAKCLHHMPNTNVLFLLPSSQVDESFLQQLFASCWQQKLINVAALAANFQLTDTYYSYSHFPEFELETKSIGKQLLVSGEFFARRLANLRGYKLPIMLGGSDPRFVVYRKSNGLAVMGGTAGHLLTTFASHFNCHFVEPMRQGNETIVAPSQHLMRAVRNGSVELSSGLTYPEIPMIGYSYPYEQMSWCLVTPVEPDVPAYEFYALVFELSAFLITLGAIALISLTLSIALRLHNHAVHFGDALLHDNCLRGALGQSFVEIANPPKIIRFIYLQICLLGILLTTSYNAYFSAYVTRAPKEQPLRNFDDILSSGKRVLIWQPEYKELLLRSSYLRKYSTIFYVEPDFGVYIKLRESFDTQFIYMMPSSKWAIVEQQQMVFTNPILRFRNDLCVYRNIPMAFPLQENSIFLDVFNLFILEVAQAGLTEYWRKIGFYELIAAGKLEFSDLSSRKEFEAMKAEDLKYVWLGMALAAVASTIVFLGELLAGHRQSLCRRFHWAPRN